ncbi:MAG: hypothetical protein EP330_14010 [Deltaproteobacteria bacterium]|nr:MAG: hypothetical protein EP330_14010 [Deltaproteobacteria bacterium]
MRWVWLLALVACAADPGPARFQVDGSGLVNCALELETGTASCWGGRDVELLSDAPRTFDEDFRKVAVNFGDNDNDGVLCGVHADGAVSCWSTATARPVAAPDLPGPAVDIAAGEAGTCAVLESGSVRCWDEDAERLAVPVGLGAVQSISVGVGSACALEDGGSVACFDWRDDASELPASVGGLEGAVAVSSGIIEACALDDRGEARCWGADGVVERAAFPGSAAQFESIYTFRCAANRNGAVHCQNVWGGADDPHVPSLSFDADGISGGWSHACAAGADGVWCWDVFEDGDAVQILE